MVMKSWWRHFRRTTGMSFFMLDLMIDCTGDQMNTRHWISLYKCYLLYLFAMKNSPWSNHHQWCDIKIRFRMMLMFWEPPDYLKSNYDQVSIWMMRMVKSATRCCSIEAPPRAGLHHTQPAKRNSWSDKSRGLHVSRIALCCCYLSAWIPKLFE